MSQNNEESAPSHAPEHQDELRVSIRHIGPIEAQELIDGSDFNRRVSKQTVSKYASDMLNGKWWENGQPIILNGKKMLNGAHRCGAVVQSGVTLRFVVVEGVDVRANRTMDIGRPRTLEQMLELESKHAPSVLAVALTHLIAFEASRKVNGRGFTVLQKFDLLAQHPVLENVAKEYTKRVPGGKWFGKGLYACMHYLFQQKSDPQQVSLFMNQVMVGEGLSKGDPAFTFREGILQFTENTDLKKTPVLQATCANALAHAWLKFKASEPWQKFKPFDVCPADI